MPKGPLGIPYSVDNIAIRGRNPNFFSSIPVPDSTIYTDKKPLRILLAEVYVAINSMKVGTAPGPDHILADFFTSWRPSPPPNFSDAHVLISAEGEDP